MFKKYISNKIEKLAELFAEQIGKSVDVFAEDVVIVQSLGMSRWLNLRLADISEFNCVANVHYFLPRNYIFKILNKLELLPDIDYMSREYSRWNIYDVLPEYNRFPVIAQYLTEPGEDLKRWQLSSRIAELFDHYLMYRYKPNEGLDNLWDDSENSKWQKQMFDGLETDKSVIQVLHNFDAKKYAPKLKEIIPEAISLFSISNMPPIFLKFFYELSLVVDVNLFYLSPAEGFWGELVSQRTKYAREIDDDMYWETGNEFLAVNCRLGQEFFLLLQDLEGSYGDEAEEHFEAVEEKPSTLLHSLQNDILYMQETEFCGSEPYQSIVFSSCHSEVRELQVLYDYILRVLNEDSSVQPSDILVMMPDVEQYAPYINAVFKYYEDDTLRIPFCLSDSHHAETNDIAVFLLKILALAKKRLTVDDVLEILENDDVADMFGISQEHMELLDSIMLDTNVAWGINRQFVQDVCDVCFANNNWQDCINRWLAGYAVAKKDFTDHMDVMPYDIEGSDEPSVIGAFISFLYKLFTVVDTLKKADKRSPEEWSSILMDIVSDFFKKNYNKSDYRTEVIKSISNLEIEADKVKFKGAISLSVVEDILQNSLNSETTYAGFLQRGVTFCKLLPMRSVPAKVICLLGMNDGAFPRTDKFMSFDLMKNSRMLGERSARYEDRYLMLETIMAVRKRLYISYIGQDVITNEKKTPSIVVSELINVLNKKTESECAVCEHSIQPFNQKYFQKDSLRSFSRQNLNIARVSLNKSEKFLMGVDDVEDGCLSQQPFINIEHFVRFFKNPVRAFLNDSLNLSFFEADVNEYREYEPLNISPGLDAWKLRKETFEMLCINEVNSMPESEIEHKIAGNLSMQGLLPVGNKGFVMFKNNIYCDVKKIYDVFAEATSGLIKEEVFVDIPLDDCRIQGTIVAYKNDKTMKYVPLSFSNLKPESLICAYIEHLLLSAVFSESKGIFIFKDKTVSAEPLNSAEAKERLTKLVKIYQDGLVKPMPFFPTISEAVYDNMLKDSADIKKIHDVCLKKWKLQAYPGAYKDKELILFMQFFGEHAPDISSELFASVIKNAESVYKLIK